MKCKIYTKIELVNNLNRGYAQKNVGEGICENVNCTSNGKKTLNLKGAIIWVFPLLYSIQIEIIVTFFSGQNYSSMI